MKKIIISIAIIFSFIFASAQTNNEHLTFKGIPITGPLNEFVSKLEKDGFTHLETTEGIVFLEGSFAGFPGCTICVSPQNVKNNNVGGVVVFFPQQEQWSALETVYTSIKNNLIQKYGYPSNCVEEFQGYSTPTDNLDKLYKLKMDLCNYTCIFENAKGFITLSLNSNCLVQLIYLDRACFDSNNSNTMDDL